jgi:ubiquinone/menaquinone biosynthesis methyltransferase
MLEQEQSNLSNKENNKPYETHFGETHFGFRKVESGKKSGLVQQIFSSVASKYDIMNDIMSLGFQRIWKKQMLKNVNLEMYQKWLSSGKISKSNPLKILDIAGGTADIALQLTALLTKNNIPHLITVADLNLEMLEIGKAKAVDLNLFHNLDFQIENGENLSFADNSFDLITIAFGIRNFTDITKGITEFSRTLKDGGTFICLEFSKVNDYFLQKIYHQYSFKIIPKLGEIVAKDRNSYQYLVESIRNFPTQDDFRLMILENGFNNCQFTNYNFGIVALHLANKG